MYTLNGYRMLNSLEELCITPVETGNSSLESSNPHIYYHLQLDSFVVSQIFGLAKHVGSPKLRSKPGRFYCTVTDKLSIREGIGQTE